MTQSTPFAKWRENNEEDPHGEYYECDRAMVSMPHLPCDLLAEMLIRLPSDYSSIAILTTGKERLRWLSRKLYKSTSDHKVINEKRAQTLQGELTDDELANKFYLSESLEDLKAGRARILWLLSEIKAA
mgnify:CR=1 FL=1